MKEKLCLRRCHDRIQTGKNKLDWWNEQIKKTFHVKGLFHTVFNTLTQSPLIRTLRKQPFENTVGRGGNPANQHFLLFPTIFSTFPRVNLSFWVKLNLSSANAYILDSPKICSLAKSIRSIPQQLLWFFHVIGEFYLLILSVERLIVVLRWGASWVAEL